MCVHMSKEQMFPGSWKTCKHSLSNLVSALVDLTGLITQNSRAKLNPDTFNCKRPHLVSHMLSNVGNISRRLRITKADSHIDWISSGLHFQDMCLKRMISYHIPHNNHMYHHIIIIILLSQMKCISLYYLFPISHASNISHVWYITSMIYHIYHI